jgi:E3 ubiquitin-protein ligase RNF5
MSFGIGAFPFGFFTTNFNFGDGGLGQIPPGSAQYEEEQVRPFFVAGHFRIGMQ